LGTWKEEKVVKAQMGRGVTDPIREGHTPSPTLSQMNCTPVPQKYHNSC